jgi:hypothetical protein
MMPQQYQLAASFLLPVFFLFCFRPVSLFNHIPLILTEKFIREKAEDPYDGGVMAVGKCSAVGGDALPDLRKTRGLVGLTV